MSSRALLGLRLMNRVAAACVLVAAVLVASPGTANGNSEKPGADSGVVAFGPSCVHIDASSVRVYYVNYYNACSVTQRRKAIIDWGPDSDCIVLSPGERWSWSYPLGSYSHTVVC